MSHRCQLSFLLLFCFSSFAQEAPKPFSFPVPERQPGQKSVLGLRVPPIANVRIAFIGVGERGSRALLRFAAFPEKATVKVACDLYQRKLDAVQQQLDKQNYPYKVDYYTGSTDWKVICKRDDLDLVYVATPPGLHVPIAIEAMKNGKHVALEVPAAGTISDCWRLVDTAEQTQRHCMMLENCNYGDYELTIMNMVGKGLFGEPVHAEAGYLHNMEAYRFNFKDEDNWRKLGKPRSTPIIEGNSYPTHGLGPIAHWLSINRGDKMNTINSVTSADFTLRQVIVEKLGPDSEYAKGYQRPDINTSIIRTAKGKTMLLFYSTVLRRPYSRAFLLNGTKGFTEGYPQRFALAPNFEKDQTPEQVKKTLEENRHPIYKKFLEEAKRFGGHGGMDTVMDLRLLYCLNNGLPLDIDVYDSAAWSAISQASLQSARLNGAPVEIPDFTRGAWETVDGVKYYYIDENGQEKTY